MEYMIDCMHLFYVTFINRLDAFYVAQSTLSKHGIRKL